jgi:hypothetical protein
LYTGNGTSQSISGLDFAPDFVWLKGRSVDWNHRLVNSIIGATKFLESNDTITETTDATQISSFTSDGFSVGSGGATNQNGTTYASWNWKAGGTAVSNTAGTITSSVSANTTSGFSIVTWTGNNTAGATIGHGLSSTPSMIIVKNRNAVTNWRVYHQALGNTGALALQDTAAFLASTGYWNDTSPTSSLITLGSTDQTNGTNPMVAYCFADVKGFSKFGSYKGNGSTDGTFVYTGFKPAFVIMKRSDSADSWLMKDSVRDSYNLANKRIFANYSVVEDSSVNGSIDILSNGFKQRGSDTLTNASGGTYIYLAIAEQPFVTSTANGSIPATAR